ncbi:MAG: HHL1-like protein [Cyanobacteria bacterium P01_A01_bin.3]
MASAQGFGPPKPKKTVSKGAKQRKAAAAKYETMQDEGLPEFNIYVRDRNKPKNWFPIGSVAVKRSSAIDAAIYQNETELLKGAFRLFPRLAKSRESLEYGHRLKDELYADEPITVAKPPVPKQAQNIAKAVGGWVQSLVGKGKRT